MQQQTPAPARLAEANDLSLEALLDLVLEASDEFAEYVTLLSESSLQEEVLFTSSYAESVSPRFEFIHHCMNHSMYHRGQMITMGRNAGLTDAPMTDYNFYLITAKQAQHAKLQRAGWQCIFEYKCSIPDS